MRLIDDRIDGFRSLLKALYPFTGRALTVGITGAPGAGKSSLVDGLIGVYRKQGKTVGVVAVDPSSPKTGGALLGDRIRMQRHFLDPDVFIRSLATRGQLGGLSASASAVLQVLDAAGFDVVLVETVGVGQDELEIARLAATTVVVVAPGMGDDIQAIKAGILEVADVFVVNKADRDGADATVRDLEQMMALGRPVSAPRSHGHSATPTQPGSQPSTWGPPVIKAIALTGEGIADIAAACDRHRQHVGAFGASGLHNERLRRQLRELIVELLVIEVDGKLASALDEAVNRIAAHTDDPYSSAERLAAGLLHPERPS